MQVIQNPSPNFNERKYPIDMLVLHYTGMETGQAALERMLDPEAEVSAHYMIWEDGRVVQLVDESMRAWHAGVSSWQGDEDLNSRSIGIEIVNGGHDWPLADGGLPPYPNEQIEAVAQICLGILNRHVIPPSRIVGHSDIASARKDDPGEHFPWADLAKRGIGIWPEPQNVEGGTLLRGYGLLPGDSGAPVRRMQESLVAIGYTFEITGHFNETTQNVVRAFQRRWHTERIDGHANIQTLVRIDEILTNISEFPKSFRV